MAAYSRSGQTDSCRRPKKGRGSCSTALDDERTTKSICKQAVQKSLVQPGRGERDRGTAAAACVSDAAFWLRRGNCLQRNVLEATVPDAAARQQAGRPMMPAPDYSALPAPVSTGRPSSFQPVQPALKTLSPVTPAASSRPAARAARRPAPHACALFGFGAGAAVFCVCVWVKSGGKDRAREREKGPRRRTAASHPLCGKQPAAAGSQPALQDALSPPLIIIISCMGHSHQHDLGAGVGQAAAHLVDERRVGLERVVRRVCACVRVRVRVGGGGTVGAG